MISSPIDRSLPLPVSHGAANPDPGPGPDPIIPDPPCESCHNVPSAPCSSCGCLICRSKQETQARPLLVCDHCDYYFHADCLQMPLSGVPEGPFFCGDWCKATAAKESNKRINTASKRKSMAMAARTKVCTVVGIHHFGPIPGIQVGMCWKYRVQLSEEGVHRPIVAGISGSAKVGSPSVVLSGGYAEDRGSIYATNMSIPF